VNCAEAIRDRPRQPAYEIKLMLSRVSHEHWLTFLVSLVVQFMMQIKFNFNNFIFPGVSATAWQRASGIRRRRWRL